MMMKPRLFVLLLVVFGGGLRCRWTAARAVYQESYYVCAFQCVSGDASYLDVGDGE